VTELFFITLIAGLILFGGEIFVPGGVLGILGGCSLVAAMIIAIQVFDTWGPYIALGIFFLAAASVVAWIKFFPGSSIGRKMTLLKDGAGFDSAQPGLGSFAGKRGLTSVACRPAGFAVIDGQRVDVVTEGGMIAADTEVEVVEIEGNRVVVRRVQT